MVMPDVYFKHHKNMVCCAFIYWIKQFYYDLFLSYASFMYINVAGFSSSKNETFRACCGTGEPYNVDEHAPCGSLTSTICSDPSKHINWDGAHFTEEAYKLIAKGLVEGPFASPSLKSPLFKIV